MVPQLEQFTNELPGMMMTLFTLALGLAVFGLFYALVAACDHL
jgi:hypothetical protein